MQVVRIDKKGRALDHVVAPKKSDNEDVIWVALGNGGPWKITFDKPGYVPAGSPFDEPEYTVRKGSSESTRGGPVNGNVNNTYKYNVRNANNNVVTDDPDIDIE